MPDTDTDELIYLLKIEALAGIVMPATSKSSRDAGPTPSGDRVKVSLAEQRRSYFGSIADMRMRAIDLREEADNIERLLREREERQRIEDIHNEAMKAEYGI